MDRADLGRRLGRLVGEFLLIVTGVVVALAADGWREDAENELAADAAIDLLLADLATDSARLAFLRVPLAPRDTLVAQIVSNADNPSFPTDSAADALGGLAFSRDYAPSRSSFDYLIQRDALRRIGDEALQVQILDYFDQRQTDVVNWADFFNDRHVDFYRAAATYQSPRADSFDEALNSNNSQFVLTETWDVIRRDNWLMMITRRVGAVGKILSARIDAAQTANSHLQAALREQRGS